MVLQLNSKPFVLGAIASLIGFSITALGPARSSAEVALEACPTGMALIAAGPFQMGEAPGHRVELPAYCIDRLPVTNAQYKQFVDSTKHAPPESILIKSNAFPDPELWRGADFPAAIASQPVVNVTWLSAQAYCHWQSKRLPTEAEWERAARGTDGRLYPWGNTPPDPARAWFGKRWQSTETLKNVGSFPNSASPQRVEDMAGNIWQWTSSIYRSSPYQESDAREDVGSPGERVLRGGSWYSLAPQLKATERWSYPPHGAEPLIGFRCARRLTSETTPHQTPDKLLALRAPLFWSIVERNRKDPSTKETRLFDIVGFVHGNLDVAISVRTIPSEGDSVEEFLADYIESGKGKPYRQSFFNHRDQVYFSVDRPVGPLEAKSPLTVDGEKAVAITFSPALAPPLDLPPFTSRVKVKEVIAKRGSNLVIFTLSGVQDEFSRDEKIFDDVVKSVHWLR